MLSPAAESSKFLCPTKSLLWCETEFCSQVANAGCGDFTSYIYRATYNVRMDGRLLH